MGQQSATIGLGDRLLALFIRQWEPDSRPPAPQPVILALQGYFGSSADYGQFAEAATLAGFAVAAFDFFGHGETGWAENLDPRSFLLVQADLIARMLQGIHSRGAIPFLLASSGSASPALLALLRLRGKLPGLDRLPVVLAEPGFVMDAFTCDYLRSCLMFLRQRYASFEQALEAWNGTELGNIRFPDQATRERYVRSRLFEEKGQWFQSGTLDRANPFPRRARREAPEQRIQTARRRDAAQPDSCHAR